MNRLQLLGGWINRLSKPKPLNEPVPKYAFCETVFASSESKWHIRKVTPEIGLRLGGGADTLSLCEKKVSWDRKVAIDAHHLFYNTCQKCLELYKEKAIQ